jgi:hypothetical protein
LARKFPLHRAQYMKLARLAFKLAANAPSQNAGAQPENRISSARSFDPEIYRQAKPHFIKAASKFGAFIHDINELVLRMMQELRDAYGWTKEMMEDADPYFKKFIEEVMAGKICKEELAGASGWEDTMSTLKFQSMALHHLKEWMPETYARLKKEGNVEEHCQALAKMAQAEYETKLKAGYKAHEAEEFALPMLRPTPETDGLDDEQRAELAEKDKEYRKNPPVQVG